VSLLLIFVLTVSDTGTPERAENGVDDSRQNSQRWEVAPKSLDDSLSYGGYVFEDAAGEGEAGEPVETSVGMGMGI